MLRAFRFRVLKDPVAGATGLDKGFWRVGALAPRLGNRLDFRTSLPQAVGEVMRAERQRFPQGLPAEAGSSLRRDGAKRPVAMSLRKAH